MWVILAESYQCNCTLFMYMYWKHKEMWNEKVTCCNLEKANISKGCENLTAVSHVTNTLVQGRQSIFVTYETTVGWTCL